MTTFALAACSTVKPQSRSELHDAVLSCISASPNRDCKKPIRLEKPESQQPFRGERTPFLEDYQIPGGDGGGGGGDGGGDGDGGGGGDGGSDGGGDGDGDGGIIMTLVDVVMVLLGVNGGLPQF